MFLFLVCCVVVPVVRVIVRENVAVFLLFYVEAVLCVLFLFGLCVLVASLLSVPCFCLFARVLCYCKCRLCLCVVSLLFVSVFLFLCSVFCCKLGCACKLFRVFRVFCS